jgi:hypothetical protein
MARVIVLPSRKVWGFAFSLGVISLIVGSLGRANQSVEPASYGDLEKGKLTLPLLRGLAMQPEVTVITPFGECDGQINMTVRWDEAEDWVEVRMRGEHVLEPYPNIDRTTGVDFFTNPFWPEPEDVVGGRYQFWFIAPGREITFYYDHTTLDLLGSEFDFPVPPAGGIPVSVPSVIAIGSDFFQPDAHGDLDVRLTWTYHDMVRGDRPELTFHYGSFPPSNLCESNQFRYDLSTTRGYTSAPRPASEAQSFREYLRDGMFYSVTIEPASYFVDPPRSTQTSAYSNGSLFGGGIPKGYTWDVDAFFMNLAPGIRPWEGANTCTQFFTGVHTKNMNFCGQ